MSALDSVANFIKVVVSTGYTSTDTTIVLNSGEGAKLPTPDFNVVWWDSTNYSDPADDPNVEIVRVTNIATDTLTVTRAQEGTTATNKNTGGSTYKMILAPTAKTIMDISSNLFTPLTATGTVDGSNSAFTFTQKPTYIVSDSAWYRENKGWTWNSGTLTATMTIPPSTDIFGIA